MPYTDDTSTTEDFGEQRAVALRKFMDETGFDYANVLEALSRVALFDARLADAHERDHKSAAYCRRAAQAIVEAQQRVEGLSK